MAIPSRTTIRLKRGIRHLKPAHIVRSAITKRTIENFTEKIGLVYVGHVNYKEDDLKLVRGYTVSPTNIDKHYSVGTVHDYDVTLLTRNDVVPTRNSKNERCHWVVYSIKLKSQVDLPNFYVGHQSRDAVFVAALKQMPPIVLHDYQKYPHLFTGDYTVYAKSADTFQISQLITPQMATVIAERFYGASFEIEDNVLILYIESRYPSEQLLDKMVSNGLWLAESLDALMTHYNKTPAE